MTKHSFVSSLMLGAGLLFVWVGERLVDGGTARTIATGLGIVLVVASLALRAVRITQSKRADAGAIERSLLWLQAVNLGALVLYFMTSDVFARVAGASLETASPKLAGVLLVLWPSMLVCGAMPLLFVELAYAAMVRAPVMEMPRIRESRNAGLGLAFALIFSFAFEYVVSERDVKRDFSYFRMARPGDATKKQVGALDAKVEVFLFFPPGSDVADMVGNYFDELKGAGPLLDVQRYDSALEPLKAKDLGVSSNGVIVIKKGERKENLFVGVEMEKSRTALRSLDSDFQKRLIQVAKAKRTVYFTQGHGERTRDPLGGADTRATVDLIYRELQGQNFDVRTLSAAEGLGNEVPSDAKAVFIVGPTTAFSPPESDAITAYANKGGRLFIALDPEAGLSADELLRPIGLSFKPDFLADEKTFVITHRSQTTADRINLISRSFSSHPSVSYLSRGGGVLIVLGAGVLDELPSHPGELSIDFPARVGPNTFNDTNHNFTFEPPEVKKSYGVVASVTKRAKSNKAEEELRALVVADSDFMADEVLKQAQGNGLFLLDGLKWLVGDDALTGETNSELDIPLTRTRQQDSLWFYGTTFLAPLLVVGAGFLFARRRANRARPTQKEAKS